MNGRTRAASPERPGGVALIAPLPPPLGGMALQGQALRDNLDSEGIEVTMVPTNPVLPFSLGQVRGLRTLLQTAIFLTRLIRVVPRVAVVHILAASYFYFFARVVPALLVSRLSGRRTILNYRGGEAPRFFESLGWALRPLLRLADVVTVPSAYLEKCFRRQDIRCEIVPNLIELDRFKFRQREHLRPRFVVTRNLEPMYNVSMALRAFEMIKRKHEDARLEIVGAGSQGEALKAWVKERGLRDVIFYGAVSNDQIPAFLERADILLNPSNVDNFPISLLEAFASGVVAVSTDVGGIPDLLGGEDAALLVKPGDYEQMAAVVEQLLTNSDLAEQISSSAHKLAKKFTWGNVRQRLLPVYFPGAAQVSTAA